MQPDHVLVRLQCNTRRQEATFCVRVQTGVPAALRCTPSTGAGGGGSSQLCDECRALLQGDKLGQRVQDLVRRGWGDHIKTGAVLVAC